ncbi:alpha/beta hydrolase [Marinactinospora thermotolerans]|uniref:S-formylglutathione hydrolase FrmB n=1 Tax=Marinactinospora thermotolerans DSM 45154 TaxID=1122192 RepID=A0A1T4N004_9ACTN|nr:alpha/beta hydrolase-fold protein [Marinactinospora thermotolerans]SJZ72367.1 S-formylglutathione hydrolase FrmB [Marinactinospora thermotolerans DSM 45154]
MFATLSRRTTVLVASSLVVSAAGMLAAFRAEEAGPVPVTAARQEAPPRATAFVEPGGGEATVEPRPGDVPVCHEPGRDEIVHIPDKGAPSQGRPIWIRRPPGEDSADLPVMYLLHGSTGTHQTVRDTNVGPLMDEQMCRVGVQFVIAAPFGQEVNGSDTEWGDSVNGDFAIESFVTGKAIEAVEGDNRRPRSLRAITGYSMGGYGAAALALRHPDLYSQSVSWGGYFKVDDPAGTFGDDPEAHAPDLLLDDPEVRDIRFFLVEGTDDYTPLQKGTIHGEAARFAKLLERRDMTVETAFPVGGHDYSTWITTYPQVVDFLVEGWSEQPA